MKQINQTKEKSKQRIRHLIENNQKVIRFSKQMSYEKLYVDLDIMNWLQHQLKNNHSIQYLDFKNCRLKIAEIKVLQLSSLPKLRALDFSENIFNNCDQKQIIKFLSKGNWALLQKIRLESNNINYYGMKYLQNSCWSQLKQIDLSYNNLSNNSLNCLARCNWGNLTTLYLINNHITNCGMKLIARGQWKNLTILDIRLNYINDEGLKDLTKNNFTKIKKIEISCYEPSRTLKETIGISEKGVSYFGKWSARGFTLSLFENLRRYSQILLGQRLILMLKCFNLEKLQRY